MKQELEMFKSQLYLPTLKPDKDIQKILDEVSSYNHLRQCPLSEIFEYAIKLQYYSLYLVQEENRLNSYIHWCENCLEDVIGQFLDDVAGYYAEKRNKIISQNDNARQYNMEIAKTTAKLDTIKYMSMNIKSLGELLRNFAYEKSKQGISV